MSGTRISAIQKDTLYVLYLLETRQGSSPFNIMQLIDFINKSRPSMVHPNNLRASIHTLCRNQYLNNYRNSSLKLAVTLTDKGRDKAKVISEQRSGANEH